MPYNIRKDASEGESSMKGLIIFTRKEKLDAVKQVLHDRTPGGMAVSDVLGCGRQKADPNITGIPLVPGIEVEIGLMHKVRIDAVVRDEDAEPLIDAICDVAATGKFGDGKIFVYDVVDAVRIRTRERGEAAL